ncbi:MAG: 1,4-dihydroxy-2-naphthoate octaprenyltransferase [Chlamydiae bacterium]|nr:1,4-dihydroxy-2-naphthoate octaprenyltransferase [Chlamydiota bacterium]
MQKTRVLRNQIWWITMRPKTLLVSICPVLIGAFLSFHHPSFSYLTFCITLLTALLIQIGTNFTNDYYDVKKGVDSDTRIGPKRGLHLGMISMKQMKQASINVFALAFIFSMYLSYVGGMVIFLFSLLAPVLGVGYTKGRFALAYIGAADPIVFLFFGPVGVWLTYYLQTGLFSLLPFIAGIAPGLLSTAILAIANFRDQEEDKKNGKMTIAARFGKKAALFEYYALLFMTPIVPIIVTCMAPLHTYTLIAVMIVFPIAKVILSPDLPKTAALLSIYTLLFCLGWSL